MPRPGKRNDNRKVNWCKSKNNLQKISLWIRENKNANPSKENMIEILRSIEGLKTVRSHHIRTLKGVLLNARKLITASNLNYDSESLSQAILQLKLPVHTKPLDEYKHLRRNLETVQVPARNNCSCPCHAYKKYSRLYAKSRKEDCSKFLKIDEVSAGRGVITQKTIDEGSFICEYRGVIMNQEMYEKMYPDTGEKNYYSFEICRTLHLYLDAADQGNISRFMNHSCEPNVTCHGIFYEGRMIIAIFAARKINMGEELTFDYNTETSSNVPVPCKCNSENCRGFFNF